MLEEKIKSRIRDIKHFPKKGIVFKDITPVLQDTALCNAIVRELAKRLDGMKADAVLGIESRGFLFGMQLALKLGVPFVPVRKMGKLPYKTVAYKYNLEYGSSTIEIHKDAIKPGSRVVIHDDLLATGGTAAATAELVKMLKGKVAAFAFVISLDFLNGKKIITPYSKKIISLVHY
jgi:adenine phosphoribosyltransferase